VDDFLLVINSNLLGPISHRY